METTRKDIKLSPDLIYPPTMAVILKHFKFPLNSHLIDFLSINCFPFKLYQLCFHNGQFDFNDTEYTEFSYFYSETALFNGGNSFQIFIPPPIKFPIERKFLAIASIHNLFGI